MMKAVGLKVSQMVLEVYEICSIRSLLVTGNVWYEAE